MADRLVGYAPWGTAALSALATAGAVTLAALQGHRSVPDEVAIGTGELVLLVPVLAFAVAGAVVASRLPRNPIGWMLCLVGLSGAVSSFAVAYAVQALIVDRSLPAGLAMAWLASWSWVLTLPPAVTLLLLLFPDGDVPSPRWRWVTRASAAVLVLMVLGFALGTGPLEEFKLRDNPLGVPGLDVLAASSILLVPLAVASIWSLRVRYRAASGDTRQQLLWIGVGAAVLAFGLALATMLSLAQGDWVGWPVAPGIVALAAAIAVAILRYRLYELDLVVNRALVYATLSALIIATYAGLVTALDALLDVSRLGAGVAGTAVVALMVQPVQRFLQRRVDRLMYGERDDPYRALVGLGSRLEQAADVDELLPAVTAAVAGALRIPYAAVEIGEGAAARLAAATGSPGPGEAVALPLRFRGERVGRLLVSPRSSREPLAARDLRLLEDLARQAGAAAHAVRVNTELRRSRERIVSAREEERRRLRRDLHDGLGPSLAGICLELEGAARALPSDPQAATARLAPLGQALQESIADVRRLVYELRPPALDDLGLVEALRAQCSQLAGNGALRIDVLADPHPPGLPAATEVAIYRIALEAVTNVVRHAHATRCQVRLHAGDSLRLEVEDNGRGVLPDQAAGVGLVSMRERAEELGGSLTVHRAGEKGTLVRAELPLKEA